MFIHEGCLEQTYLGMSVSNKELHNFNLVRLFVFVLLRPWAFQVFIGNVYSNLLHRYQVRIHSVLAINVPEEILLKDTFLISLKSLE